MARSIFTHQLFTGDAYSKREAWLYMVAGADFTTGIVTCSESELAAVFSWHKSRVHRFLCKLFSESMIESVTEPKSNQERTSYRIVNYDKYQAVSTKTEPGREKKSNRSRTSERIAPINKDLNTLNTNTTQNPLPPSLDSEEFRKALDAWVSYKKEQFNFTYKPVALEGLISSLEPMGSARATKAIRHTIAKGWKGIRENTEQTFSGGNSGFRQEPKRVPIPVVKTEKTTPISESDRLENLKKLKQITGGIGL